MKSHGEKKLGSKHNWKTEKELIEKLVLEHFKKWKNRKGFAVLKLRDLENYERMIFPTRIVGKRVHNESAYGSNSGFTRENSVIDSRDFHDPESKQLWVIPRFKSPCT